MDINQLMNSLKETYGFSKTEWNELNGEPLAEFSLWLTEEHISRFIEKAGRLTAIIESCANMVSICEPELKGHPDGYHHPVLRGQTSLRSAPLNPC